MTLLTFSFFPLFFLGLIFLWGCRKNIILYVYLVGIVVFNIIGMPFLLAGANNPYGLNYAGYAYIAALPLVQFFIGIMMMALLPSVPVRRVKMGLRSVCILPEISFFFAVIIVIHMIYKIGLPPIFLADVTSSNAEIISVRASYLSTLDTAWFYRIGLYHLPMLAVFSAILNYSAHPTFILLLRAILCLAIAFFMSIFLLHKTPALMLVISTVLLFALLRGSRGLSIGLVGKLSLSATFFIAIAYTVFYGIPESRESAESLLIGVSNRIFGAYIFSLAALEPLIAEYGHGYGASIINPMGLFDYTVIPLGSMIHLEMFGVIGNAPPPSIGYIYFDFGIVGVLFASLLIPMFLWLLGWVINKLNPYYRVWSLVYIGISALMLATQSFFEAFLNPAVFITLVVVFIVSEVGSRVTIGRRRVQSSRAWAA